MSFSLAPLPSIGVVGIVAVGLSACGEPIGNPDPFIPPGATDFRGSYDVTHTFSVPGTARSSGCTGSAELSTDFPGLAFSGSIDIDGSGPCSAFPSRVGQLVGAARDESIRFSVSGLGDPMETIGCAITGGNLNFDGSITTRPFGDLMRVQSFRGTRDVRVICDGGSDEVAAHWEIRGRRR